MIQPVQAKGRRKFIGRSPRFRGGEAGLKQSPYYWWWEFLRRNDGYVRCCKAGGTGPFAALYRNFGDVRSDDFRKWWRTVGEIVFSEPPVPTSIQVAPDLESLRHLNLTGCLTVVVPLALDKRALKRRFNELLNKHHQGRRGGNRFVKSMARYPLASKPVPLALERTLRVYDLKKEHPDWPLWRIGQEANVSPAHKVDARLPASHTRDARVVLAVLTSRYLKNATNYVRNAGKGQFPKK